MKTPVKSILGLGVIVLETVAVLTPLATMANGFPAGYVKLTTQFREGANECHEGNHDGRRCIYGHLSDCYRVDVARVHRCTSPERGTNGQIKEQAESEAIEIAIQCFWTTIDDADSQIL